LQISLIATTILAQFRKTKKPPGVFLYAFFEEKCFWTFVRASQKKCAMQPARYEPFTNHQKTGHLYDSTAFSSDALTGNSQRNLFKLNKIGAKRAAIANRQNLVTYNNKPSAKPEIEAIYLTVRTISHFEVGW
jgi:hypothetical protein